MTCPTALELNFVSLGTSMPIAIQSSTISALLPISLPQYSPLTVATDANGFKIPNSLIAQLNAQQH